MKNAINKIYYFVFSFRKNEKHHATRSSGIEQGPGQKHDWAVKLLQGDNPGLLENELDIKGLHEALDNKTKPKNVHRNYLFPTLPCFHFSGNIAVTIGLFLLLSLVYYPGRDQQGQGMSRADSLQVNQQHLDTIQIDHSLKDTIFR
jgi:hypothetical protein